VNNLNIILIYLILLISENLTAQSGWVQQNGNISKNLSDVFFVNDQKGWIVTDSSMILSTSNGGLTWSQQTLPYYSPLNTVFFINENTGWVAGGYYYIAHFGVIYKTTNGGNNWFLLTYSGEIQNICFVNENTGFIALNGSGDFTSGGHISKTINGGLSWTGEPSNTEFKSISFRNNDTGFAIGVYWNDTGYDTSYVYRTTNSGNNWEKKYKENSYPIYSNALKDVCVKGNKVWASGYSSSMLFSSDNGETWGSQILPVPCQTNSIYFVDQFTGWAVGSGFSDSTNINKTTNGGVNWINQRNNFPSWLNSVMFINYYTGWAVGRYGVILRTTNGGLTFAENSFSESPTLYYLSQNYPNPFNPVTNLGFGISDLGFVSLKLYDAIGKELRTLVNESRPAGNYNIEFDGSDLPSGIYFYKFEVGDFVETKSMILLK